MSESRVIGRVAIKWWSILEQMNQATSGNIAHLYIRPRTDEVHSEPSLFCRYSASPSQHLICESVRQSRGHNEEAKSDWTLKKPASATSALSYLHWTFQY